MEDCTNWKYALGKGTILRGDSYVYEIKAVLGHGTFGITYLATVRLKGALGELSGGMQVAIKEFFMRNINGRQGTTVLTGSEGGLYEEYKRKFRREAVNLSKLSHPSIVKVLESFEANNTVYYVMEYVDGGSLDKYIAEKGGLDEKEALARARQIGGALAFMHARGMLHLDLKPGNVMRSADGRMILIDFGLAKQYDENGEPESSTDVGGGTPGYAPVEQANYHEGKDFPVTMDVYALGATLYKMLTGERPPEASEVLNEGLDTEKLRTRGVTEHVIARVEKAMAPTRKQRYQSVGEFLEALTGEALEETGGAEDTVTDEDTGMKAVPHVSRKAEERKNPAPRPMRRGTQAAVYGVAAITAIISWVFWRDGVNGITICVTILGTLAAAYLFIHAGALRERRWLWLLVLAPVFFMVNVGVKEIIGGITFREVMTWWVVDAVAMVVALRFASPLGRWFSEKKRRRWLLLAIIPAAYLVNAFLGGSAGEVLLPIFEAVLIVMVLPLTFRMKERVLRTMVATCIAVMIMCLVFIAYIFYVNRL